MKGLKLATLAAALLPTFAFAGYTVVIPIEVPSTNGTQITGGSLPENSIVFVNQTATTPEEPVDENANWNVITTRQASSCVNDYAGTVSNVYYTPSKSNTGGTVFPSDNNCGFYPVGNQSKVNYYYSGYKYYDLFGSYMYPVHSGAPSTITVEVDGVEDTCTKDTGAFKDVSSDGFEKVVYSFRLTYNCTKKNPPIPQTLKVRF
ncbi:hypothetical protein E6W26_29135 [Pseudomonas aeruginosa]|uniref:hypothetical protein n=1 Tax=Pseudomonas aeruginosa TaxID=287 RepID=UPI00109E2B62|nr:hypothetical protein [Pseudomonas aeruginosa]EKV1241260.1 hypothetical protein [Pseudomonas aeruginosa]EKV8586169.1 hypothetical protein [Pseudomonas aeruginosa]ELN5407387.1 hypothetical protein [Pseudomonas aeruginosa]ELP1438578.1 hypothetical protein [Pseudomonas aeruginosa]THB16464.1 hypothetical protein E6W26_29135 [Pseudomonas aeruginosa]